MPVTRTSAAEAEVPQQQQHVDQNGHVFELPDFTMKQIYDAIPPHCFRPSTLRSMAYVFRDFAYASALIYAATYIQFLPNVYARALAWAAYTVVQGMVFTGIWILAHECGHGAFSKHKTLNNIMGLVMHSFVLVPFHSWKISHSNHHKGTGSLEKDTVFIPHDRQSWLDANVRKHADPKSVDLSHLAEDAPLVVLWNCIVHQIIGFPGYLLFNLTGQDYPLAFPKKSHFYAGEDNPLYKKEQLPLIVLSDVGIVTMIAMLAVAGHIFGSWNMILIYAIPYLWVNHWIVALTFLQHTDGMLPHYSNKTWTFARGATATIDRDFGFIDRHLFHDIIGTHVCHHLVSTIPFYHAEEATRAIRTVMGPHYKADTATPFLTAFWRNQKHCHFVEESVDDSGVFFFRNLHGVGAPARDLTDGRASAPATETKDPKAAAAACMSSSRNLDAKRRFSNSFPATLPILAE
ncbi:MAG: hypothetical protein M1818_003737 [Claussenomyces sp. TS43310]|nr:MAG: hypothetical protein M1818_003737 [Claussenomyces sp. TS43310]